MNADKTLRDGGNISLNTAQRDNIDARRQKVAYKFKQYMNNISLSRKLTLLYVCCVLLPLVVTDSVVLYIVVNNQHTKQQHAMENTASAIQYSLTNSIEYAAATAKQIYMNEYIERYLNREYEGLCVCRGVSGFYKNDAVQRRRRDG